MKIIIIVMKVVFSSIGLEDITAYVELIAILFSVVERYINRVNGYSIFLAITIYMSSLTLGEHSEQFVGRKKVGDHVVKVTLVAERQGIGMPAPMGTHGSTASQAD